MLKKVISVVLIQAFLLSNISFAAPDTITKPEKISVPSGAGALAPSVKSHLISLSPKGLAAYMKNVVSGDQLTASIKDLQAEWVEVYINGVKVGAVNIRGYVRDMADKLVTNPGVTVRKAILETITAQLEKRCLAPDAKVPMTENDTQKLVGLIAKQLESQDFDRLVSGMAARLAGAKAANPAAGSVGENSVAGSGERALDAGKARLYSDFLGKSFSPSGSVETIDNAIPNLRVQVHGDFRGSFEDGIAEYNYQALLENGATIPFSRIHPGTWHGTTEQMHISRYIWDSSDNIDVPRRFAITDDDKQVIGNHEKAHLDIYKKRGRIYELWQAYVKNCVDKKQPIDQEYFVDNLPGCNTDKVREKIREIQHIRIFKKMDRALKANDIRAITVTLTEAYTFAANYEDAKLLSEIADFVIQGEYRDAVIHNFSEALLQVAKWYPLWSRQDLFSAASADAMKLLRGIFNESGANALVGPKDVVAVIMAGGGGERLMPISTKRKPKQLAEVVDKPLLFMAIERVAKDLGANNVYIQTVPDLRKDVLALLKEYERQSGIRIPEANVFAEPKAADTSGAIGYAAAKLKRLGRGNDVMFVCTADHYIDTASPAFRESYMKAATIAKHSPIIGTLGIDPEPIGVSGEYGCIRQGDETFYQGARIAQTFKEKPSVVKKAGEAKSPAEIIFDDRMEDGKAHRWLYNSGMFIGRAETFLTAFREVAPAYGEQFDRIANPGTKDQRKIDEIEAAAFDVLAGFKKAGEFPHSAEPLGTRRGNSVDYVMAERLSLERAETDRVGLVLIPGVFKWKDIGGYKSIHEYYRDDYKAPAAGLDKVYKDANGNIVISPKPSNVRLSNCSGCLILADSPDVKLNLEGLKDVVIAYNPDTKFVLIAPKNVDGKNIKTVLDGINKNPAISSYATGEVTPKAPPYSMTPNSRRSHTYVTTGLGVVLDMANQPVALKITPRRENGFPEITVSTNRAIMTEEELRYEDGKRAGTYYLANPATSVTVDKITRNRRYEESLEDFPQGPFGTSGIRATMEFLHAIQCYTIMQGIASFLTEEDGSRSGSVISVSGDRRPSTDEILLGEVSGILDFDRQVYFSKNIPTSAITYYGLYNTGKAGRTPTIMTTASHNPYSEELGYWNGFKPTKVWGEVLKRDERKILAHVREMREIEYRLSSDRSLFDAKGEFKKEGLTPAQADLLKRAQAILAQMNKEAEELYFRRYTGAFGKVFNNEVIGFWQHTAVGRDLMPAVLNALGADTRTVGRREEWDIVIDTEDIKPNTAEEARRLTAALKADVEREHKTLLGLGTSDGDSDRPGLFDEFGEFNYGDKLDYLACEYIKSKNPNKKMHVVVTASVNERVIRKFEEVLGVKVHKVMIGSPYVVQKIDEVRNANPDAIVVGFERNGGFLTGTDIMLGEGRVLKALPTRDAMLPLICAFAIAAREHKTISQLIADRFSGKYGTFSWSGLVENTTKGDEYATKWCSKYTAPIGQAIMRDFSPPHDKKIMEVAFDGQDVKYETLDGRADVADADLTEYMQGIRTRLKKYFNDAIIPAEIVRINYLDGVRMYFANGEVIHMRPSGNVPQWRIYTEAANLARAKELVEARLKAYPAIMEDFITKGEELKRTTRFVPKSIREIMALLGVKEYGALKTFEMAFGNSGQHRVNESYEFTADALTIRSSRSYDNGKNNVERRIVYIPGQKVEITERVNGEVTVQVAVTGEKAYIDIGKALDRNVPMFMKKTPFGKEAPIGIVEPGQSFLLMDDEVIETLGGLGVSFLHLFDVIPTSVVAAEPLLWEGTFKFDKVQAAPAAMPIATTESSIGRYSIGPAASVGMSADDGYAEAGSMLFGELKRDGVKVSLDKLFTDRIIGNVAADMVNGLNAYYASITPSPAVRSEILPVIEAFYRGIAERALDVDDIETSHGLQVIAGQGLALITLIDQRVPGAEKVQLTANIQDMLPPDKNGNLSYISRASAEESGSTGVAANEGNEGLFWRGAEGIGKFGIDETGSLNVLESAIYDWMKFGSQASRLGKLVMYTMLHVGGYHTTIFLHDTLPGSIQHTSTGPGHLQITKDGRYILDVKAVVRGTGIQYIKVYDENGKLVNVVQQGLRPGTWFAAIPGTVDSVENTGGLVFNDFSIEVSEADALRLMQAVIPGISLEKLRGMTAARGIVETMLASKNKNDSPNQVPFVAFSTEHGPMLLEINPAVKVSTTYGLTRSADYLYVSFIYSHGTSRVAENHQTVAISSAVNMLTTKTIYQMALPTQTSPADNAFALALNHAKDVARKQVVQTLSEGGAARFTSPGNISIGGREIALAELFKASPEAVFGEEHLVEFGGPVTKLTGMNEAAIKETLARLKAAGTVKEAKFEAVKHDEYTFLGMYTIPQAQKVVGDEFVKGRFHTLFVAEGKVEIKNEKTGKTEVLETGASLPIFANYGKYSMRSLSGQAAVFTQYEPLRREKVVHGTFNAVERERERRKAEFIRGVTRSFTIWMPQTLYRGNYAGERDLIEFISEDTGKVTIRQYTGFTPEETLDFKPGDVMVATDRDLKNISPAMREKLVRSRVVPVRQADVDRIQQDRLTGYAREIESVAFILGDTTLADTEMDRSRMQDLYNILRNMIGPNVKPEDIRNLLPMAESLITEQNISERFRKLWQELPLAAAVDVNELDDATKRRREADWSV